MDATKNTLDSKKKFQIPEKSEEEKAYDEYLKGIPNREEISHFVSDFISTVLNSSISSINIALLVFERVLLDKNIVTESDLKKAKESILNEIEKANKANEINKDSVQNP